MYDSLSLQLITNHSIYQDKFGYKYLQPKGHSDKALLSFN